MAHMSGNNECPSGNFGESSQLTNWILNSGTTCHMTPDISDFISGSLEDTDKKLKFWTDITSRKNKMDKYE